MLAREVGVAVAGAVDGPRVEVVGAGRFAGVLRAIGALALLYARSSSPAPAPRSATGPRPEPAPPTREPATAPATATPTSTAHRSTASVLRAYHELTKPGITLFVGLSAAAGYVVSAHRIDAATLVIVLLATMLLSSGAAAHNQVAERALDARMARTARRPLPAGIISPASASAFGWLLTCVGAALATMLLPPLAFVFLAACHITYIYCYTPLKRRHELCTLVGAVPGALPVLAGSAAAGGMPGAAALALTGLLFAWQIPHFMAIGWLARADYARADFRMLPVIDATGRRTARVALLYAIATQGCAVLVTRAAGVGALTMAVVHTAGTLYILAVVPFLLQRKKEQARRLFIASLVVLPVILGALMLSFA